MEKSEQMVSLTTEMRGIVEKTGHERVCEEGKEKVKERVREGGCVCEGGIKERARSHWYFGPFYRK